MRKPSFSYGRPFYFPELFRKNPVISNKNFYRRRGIITKQKIKILHLAGGWKCQSLEPTYGD